MMTTGAVGGAHLGARSQHVGVDPGHPRCPQGQLPALGEAEHAGPRVSSGDMARKRAHIPINKPAR